MIGKVTGRWKPAVPLLLRVAVGSVLLYHGLDRIGIVGPDGFRASIHASIQEAAQAGLNPPELFGYLIALCETVGGGLLLVGLFTRYAAGVLALLLAYIIVTIHWGRGFSGWGYLYTLLSVCLSLVITGGGLLSADELLWPPRESSKKR